MSGVIVDGKVVHSSGVPERVTIECVLALSRAFARSRRDGAFPGGSRGARMRTRRDERADVTSRQSNR
jgi:hypothetical protein